jgi:hypothetical protein
MLTNDGQPTNISEVPKRQPPEPNTLQVENEALRRGFTLIPNYVLRARGLSRDAKLLYGILLSYAWQDSSCFPGYEVLMEDMQCHREALAKYIKELKEKGWIEVRRRGQGKTSIYTIKDQGSGRAVGTIGGGAAAKPEPQKFDNRTSRSSISELAGVRKPNGEEYSAEEDTKNNITDDVAQQLIDFGITKSVARRLAAEYPAERIYAKLELVTYLQETNSPLARKNPHGWLIRAIEEDYGKPKGFKSRADRDQEAATKAEQDRQREAEAAEIERAQAERREAIKAFIAGQPAKPIKGTELDTKTAWAQVLQRLKGQLSPLNFAMMLEHTFLADYDGQEAVIGTPSRVTAQLLETRLTPFLTQALMDTLDRHTPPRLYFEVAQFSAIPEPVPTFSPGPS